QCVLASIKANGSPKIQTLVFQDFFKTDNRVLLFSAPTRSSELMSVVKVSQTHEILWQFPKTHESYTLSGRLFIVCAPTLSHRFGSIPRNVLTPPDLSSTPANPSTPRAQEEFWDSERARIWAQLTPAYRASFTWPSSGENKRIGLGSEGSVYRDLERVKVSAPGQDAGFKITKLDAMDISTSSGAPTTSSTTSSGGGWLGGGKPGTTSKEEEARCVHNAAYDNFCILVFKASRVDHVNSAVNPPVRMVYAASKEGAWVVDEVNP
ncbi:hypothetical protein HK101_004864, partial [Irineochytrium annulatum]